MALHPFARIAVFALAARPAAGLALDRRAALRWTAGASAGLVAERASAETSDAPAAEPPAAPPAAEPKPAPAKLFDVTLPFKGKDVPLSKFRGDAHLVVNIKMDDPVAGANFNAMRYAAKEYPGADAASSLNLTRSRRWRLRDATSGRGESVASMALARTSTPSSDVGFMITRESARLVDVRATQV